MHLCFIAKASLSAVSLSYVIVNWAMRMFNSPIVTHLSTLAQPKGGGRGGGGGGGGARRISRYVDEEEGAGEGTDVGVHGLGNSENL
eukprot:756645-Hanusia_phi.AAC.1